VPPTFTARRVGSLARARAFRHHRIRSTPCFIGKIIDIARSSSPTEFVIRGSGGQIPQPAPIISITYDKVRHSKISPVTRLPTNNVGHRRPGKAGECWFWLIKLARKSPAHAAIFRLTRRLSVPGSRRSRLPAMCLTVAKLSGATPLRPSIGSPRGARVECRLTF
jgi:hypothetical protein